MILARLTRAACTLAAACLVFGHVAPAAADESAKYGLQTVGASLSSVQAGAHADFTTTIGLTRNAENKPYAQTRNLEVHLPPGLVGNPQAVPSCTVKDLGTSAPTSHCPIASQVGVTEISVNGTLPGTFLEPVYNMVPPEDENTVARLGFIAAGVPTFLNVELDPRDDALIAKTEGQFNASGLVEAITTLWGVPADPSHDLQRITPLEANEGGIPSEPRSAGIPPAPFLTNPTDCTPGREITVSAVSYQRENEPSTMSAPFPPITGCGKLSFAPTLTVVPTNPEASAPTGLDAELRIPQDETPQGLGVSTLRSAVVTLPPGLTINPAAGNGLDGCSAGQARFGETVPAACPDASKIGTAEMDVPALAQTLHGSLYQQTPTPGALFRFWLISDEQGVHLKIPARIEPNPITGQLTAIFAGLPALGGNPNVPFRSLRLHVEGGSRAPLSTPAACGTYRTHFRLAPWSGNAPVEGDTAMSITSGCGKGGFDPRISAGTTNPGGGRHSPFTFTLTRQDGEANPRDLEVHLPEGLLAKLGSVPLCPEAQAGSGACPASSQVGTVTTAAGVGGAPLWIPQPGKAPTALYLAGPYKGAPYSLIAVVPAQAGPFDLGTVVDRSAIYVDPMTAEATVKSDPLPQILEGVPIAYRAINVTVDHPEFTLNPTSCEAKTISAPVTASNGATAAPSTGFQATNCANLAFKPKLKIQLKGSTRRTGHPSLKAVVTYPKGAQANIARAQVGLPHSLFLDQGNLNKTCTRPVLMAGNCPASTVYGHAKAWTPLLAEPLQGPVYLVGGFGYKLPALVAELNGKVRILLKGKVDTTRQHGIRNTFEAVPDAPVSRFVLQMKGGRKYSLIENSENLCASPQRANARFAGQNGAVSQQHPKIAVKCGKRHGKHARHRRGGGKKKGSDAKKHR